MPKRVSTTIHSATSQLPQVEAPSNSRPQLARLVSHSSVALSLRSAPGNHSRRCCRQPACSSKGSTSGGPSGPAHQPWLTAAVEMTASRSHHMWPCRPKRLRNLRAKRTWSCKTFTKVTVISNLQIYFIVIIKTTNKLLSAKMSLSLGGGLFLR